MPLETEVPVELDRIKRKVMLGLTMRKLVCLALALGVTGGITYLSFRFELNTQVTGWLIIVLAGLPFALGVLEPGGVPPEQYLLRKLRHLLTPSRLCYRAEPVWITTPKEGGKKLYGKTPMEAQNTVWFDPDARRKERRKQTVRRIKNAQSEHKAAEKAAGRARAAQRP